MSTHIRKRRTAKGFSYQVRYRRGGRAFAIEIAGSFSSAKEAKIRRDLVAGWLAAGLDPKAELAKIGNRKPPRLLRDVAKDYEASRVDLAEGSRREVAAELVVDGVFRLDARCLLLAAGAPSRLAAAEIAGHFVERPARRRKTDALRRLLRQRGEPLE